MSRQNTLHSAPPFPVEQSLKRFGERLRKARLRRSLTLDEVGSKFGAGVRAIRDAENGRTSASIGTYWGLLWAYDLLGPTEDLADPAKDVEGSALEIRRLRGSNRRTKALDNDF
jgi:transcriptional regulator with XRE-family HTH domain